MKNQVSVKKFLTYDTINSHRHTHSHSHLILDRGSAYDDVGGGFAPLEVIIICRSRILDQVAVAAGMVVAVAVDCVVG